MKQGGHCLTKFLLVTTFFFSSLNPFLIADDTPRDLIFQAQTLQKNNQYDEALHLLENALAQTPESKQIEKAIHSIKNKEADKYFRAGFSLYRKKQYEEALKDFETSLSIRPNHARTEKYHSACLAKLSPAVENPTDAEGGPRPLIADGRGKIPNLAKARVFYDEGKSLINQGKFDRAREKFEQVLEINPFHVAARKYIILLQHREHSIENENQAISEEDRMLEVRKEWLPPEKKKVITEIVQPWKAPVGVSQARKQLEDQAQQIIPAINFNNAHLSDIIKYLSKVSGINIIIDESVFQALSTEEAPMEETTPPEGETAGPERQAPLARAPSVQAGPFRKSDRVTIAIRDVPLIEALKYILRAKGLRYLIEDFAIIIVAADYVPPEDMETRYYHLSSGIGTFTSFDTASAEEAPSEGEGAEGGSQVAETITIKDILEQSGVPWPLGSKIFLDQRTGTLIVRNTPTNLKIVEDILRTLDVAPYQVAITARFIELENKDAEEMGLEWILKDDLKFFLHEGSTAGLTPAGALQRVQFDRLNKTVGANQVDQSLTGNNRFFTTDPLTGQVSSDLTGGSNPILSFSGILTKPEFSVVLHAINQKTKNNVLSSPRVTTVNGQRAQIKVVQEFIYPTEYEVTPATTNSQGSVTTPPVVAPGSFETRDIGIVLDVTPNVGADRKTINLTIIPEVSEFITWLDYGVPTQEFGDAASPRTLPGYPILQPLFATRTVTTSVIVNDGDTVVLGGLIRDQINAYNDKIPFLGDIPVLGLLFRKKGEISVKKNLIIFVTAELLTPEGEPYAPTQFEPGETLVPLKPEGAIPEAPQEIPQAALVAEQI